jgi:hypothetical protein
MSVLINFEKEFNNRHDFNDMDIDYLSERHPRVNFEDIPTAWVAVIDDLLISIKANLVKEISQKFGQLIILTNKKPTKKQLSLIKNAEEEIYSIDVDLYEKYGLMDILPHIYHEQK